MAASKANMAELMQVLRSTKLNPDDDELVANNLSGRLFDAYNLPHDPHMAHEFVPENYGELSNVRDGYFTTKLVGCVPKLYVPDGGRGRDWPRNAPAPPKVDNRRVRTDAQGKPVSSMKRLKIAYTTMGDRGPVWVFLHGVPQNRRAKYPVMRRMGKFCRTICFDMLGMGQSDMPLNFPWSWEMHATYVPALIEHVLQTNFGLARDTKVFFQSDDWGAGIHMKVAELPWAENHIYANCVVHPIAFSGYFIAEIGAAGRASGAPWPDPGGPFESAMGAIDQGLVQIEKSMVGESHGVTNQWQQRDDILQFAETDYERNWSGQVQGTGRQRVLEVMNLETDRVYTARSRQLRMWNVRVWAQQSGYLRPAALQPYHAERNPQGIQYDQIRGEFMVAWGRDNMMPRNQMFHFKYALPNARVRVARLCSDGHFAEKMIPAEIAAIYLDYTEEILGLGSLAQPFLGFENDKVHKGDEKERAQMLADIYGVGK